MASWQHSLRQSPASSVRSRGSSRSAAVRSAGSTPSRRGGGYDAAWRQQPARRLDGSVPSPGRLSFRMPQDWGSDDESEARIAAAAAAICCTPHAGGRCCGIGRGCQETDRLGKIGSRSRAGCSTPHGRAVAPPPRPTPPPPAAARGWQGRRRSGPAGRRRRPQAGRASRAPHPPTIPSLHTHNPIPSAPRLRLQLRSAQLVSRMLHGRSPRGVASILSSLHEGAGGQTLTEAAHPAATATHRRTKRTSCLRTG